MSLMYPGQHWTVADYSSADRAYNQSLDELAVNGVQAVLA